MYDFACSTKNNASVSLTGSSRKWHAKQESQSDILRLLWRAWHWLLPVLRCRVLSQQWHNRTRLWPLQAFYSKGAELKERILFCVLGNNPINCKVYKMSENCEKMSIKASITSLIRLVFTNHRFKANFQCYKTEKSSRFSRVWDAKTANVGRFPLKTNWMNIN